MTTESTASPAEQIAAGYATQGPALELGAVVVDGSCDPTAQVRIPLATVNRHGLIAGATGTGKTKSLQALTKTVRTYPKTDVYELEKALTSLGIGEAIVTVLSEKGAPTPVAWTRMRAPRSLMGAIGNDAMAAAAKASPLQAKYGQTIDPQSAYEILQAKVAPPPAAAPADAPLPPPIEQPVLPNAEGEVKSRDTAEPGMLEKMMASPAFKSAMRSAGTVIGREITRSIFGTARRRR